MSTARDSARYETSIPLVSRALVLFVAVTSLPVLGVVAFLTVVENDPLWVVALAALLLFGPLVVLRRLRLELEVVGDELRYRVRPWHRHPRVVRVDSRTTVERFGRRPASRLTLRRVNLGRDWIDWTDDEVRYVLDGDEGLTITRDDGRSLTLWFSEAGELARVLDEMRDDRRRE